MDPTRCKLMRAHYHSGLTQAQALLTPDQFCGADIIGTVMDSLTPFARRHGFVFVNSEEYETLRFGDKDANYKTMKEKRDRVTPILQKNFRVKKHTAAKAIMMIGVQEDHAFTMVAGPVDAGTGADIEEDTNHEHTVVMFILDSKPDIHEDLVNSTIFKDDIQDWFDGWWDFDRLRIIRLLVPRQREMECIPLAIMSLLQMLDNDVVGNLFSAVQAPHRKQHVQMTAPWQTEATERLLKTCGGIRLTLFYDLVTLYLTNDDDREPKGFQLLKADGTPPSIETINAAIEQSRQVAGEDIATEEEDEGDGD